MTELSLTATEPSQSDGMHTYTPSLRWLVTSCHRSNPNPGVPVTPRPPPRLLTGHGAPAAESAAPSDATAPGLLLLLLLLLLHELGVVVQALLRLLLLLLCTVRRTLSSSSPTSSSSSCATHARG